jgi:hypothetical protein
MSVTIVRYRHIWETPAEEVNGSHSCHTTQEAALEDRVQLITRVQKSPKEYSDYFDESWPFEIEKRDFPVVPLPDDQAVVMLDEEHGYRSWLWYTGMAHEELKAYWEGLATVQDFFFDPTKLKGLLVPWWPDGGEPEKGLFTYDRADFKYNEGDVEGTVVWMAHEDILWRGHIHQDDDSGIGCPEYGSVRHKGFQDEGDEHE